MSLVALIKGLDKFLFYPQSPTPIALFRIILGLILLQDIFLHLLPDFKLYFADHALVPIESIMANSWGRDNYFDLLLLLPPGEHWKMALLVVLIVAAVFTTFGLYTRISTAIAFFCLLSFHSHFTLGQNNGDVLLRLSLMILTISNSQDAFSIDNLIKAARQDWRMHGFAPRLSAPWAQRMLQLQTVFIYLQNFFTELTDAHWINGLAVYYASRYDDVTAFALPKFFDNLPCFKVFAWGTMALQFCLCTLIWFREFRYWIILAAIVRGLGIELFTALPVFEAILIASYVLFVEPNDLSKAMDSIKLTVHKYFGPTVFLAYDGDCLFCVRTIGILHRLDIFGFLTLVNFRDENSISSLEGIDMVRAEKEMLLKAESHWLGGFQAFCWLTLRLPLLAPLFPFLYIPGVAYLAEHVYRIISANRKLIVGGSCDHKLCQEQR